MAIEDGCIEVVKLLLSCERLDVNLKSISKYIDFNPIIK